jgi:hypothetical protein
VSVSQAKCPNCADAIATAYPTVDGLHWARCTRCGLRFQVGGFGPATSEPAPFQVQPAPAMPVYPPIKRRSRSPLRLLFMGPTILLSTLLPMVFIFCPRACSSIDDSHQVALDELRRCPRAHVLLGRDIDAAWVGMHTGESSSGGSYGSAQWSFAVEGSSGRGTYSYSAVQRGGPWELMSATLVAGGQTVQVPGGCGAAPEVIAPAPLGTSSSPGTRPPSTDGACDRLARCCATPAGTTENLRAVCTTVPLLRTTANGEQSCQQIFGSAAFLLSSDGQALPPECR